MRTALLREIDFL